MQCLDNLIPVVAQPEEILLRLDMQTTGNLTRAVQLDRDVDNILWTIVLNRLLKLARVVMKIQFSRNHTVEALNLLVRLVVLAVLVLRSHRNKLERFHH